MAAFGTGSRAATVAWSRALQPDLLLVLLLGGLALGRLLGGRLTFSSRLLCSGFGHVIHFVWLVVPLGTPRALIAFRTL